MLVSVWKDSLRQLFPEAGLWSHLPCSHLLQPCLIHELPCCPLFKIYSHGSTISTCYSNNLPFQNFPWTRITQRPQKHPVLSVKGKVFPLHKMLCWVFSLTPRSLQQLFPICSIFYFPHDTCDQNPDVNTVVLHIFMSTHWHISFWR